MKNSTMFLIGFAVLLFFYGGCKYNGMVKTDEGVKQKWGNVQTQYQRRADLIPNLIETVKGYVTHEKTVLEEVTKARTAMMSATTTQDKLKADEGLQGALKTLFAVSEAYPDLKANQNFMQLQQELTDTEDKVSYSRQFFNTGVLEYNNQVQSFPSNLIAGQFGFKPYEYFEAKPEEREVVQVKF